MIDSAPTAKKYRAHALSLRKAAKAAIGPDSRAGFLSIALNYDRLASFCRERHVFAGMGARFSTLRRQPYHHKWYFDVFCRSIFGPNWSECC